MDSTRAIRSGTAAALLSCGLAVLTPFAGPARAQSAAPPAATAPADSAAAASPPKLALGCADGERDAAALHDPIAYQVGGILTGPVGLGFALWRSPKPSAGRLAAVAPEGAAEYARCYGARARKMNVKAAANGFAITTITALVINYYLDSKTAP